MTSWWIVWSFKLYSTSADICEHKVLVLNLQSSTFLPFGLRYLLLSCCHIWVPAYLQVPSSWLHITFLFLHFFYGQQLNLSVSWYTGRCISFIKDDLTFSVFSYTTSSQYNVYTMLVHYTCLCCSSLSCGFFQKNMRKRQPVPLTVPNSKQDRLFTNWRQIPAGTLQASHIWNAKGIWCIRVQSYKWKWQGKYRKHTASRPRWWIAQMIYVQQAKTHNLRLYWLHQHILTSAKEFVFTRVFCLSQNNISDSCW